MKVRFSVQGYNKYYNFQIYPPQNTLLTASILEAQIKNSSCFSLKESSVFRASLQNKLQTLFLGVQNHVLCPFIIEGNNYSSLTNQSFVCCVVVQIYLWISILGVQIFFLTASILEGYVSQHLEKWITKEWVQCESQRTNVGEQHQHYLSSANDSEEEKVNLRGANGSPKTAGILSMPASQAAVRHRPLHWLGVEPETPS